MRKEIIFVLLLLSIPFIASECTDSDGGIDYYKKGTTSGTNDAILGGFVEATDYCSEKILYEYYCMDLSTANTTYNSVVAKMPGFVCSYDCVNGICINEPEEKEATKKSSGGSSSSSNDDEEETPFSGNAINLDNENNEESKQQVIILGQEKEDSSDNLLFIFLGGISFVLIFGVLVLYIFSKTKKRK